MNSRARTAVLVVAFVVLLLILGFASAAARPLSDWKIYVVTRFDDPVPDGCVPGAFPNPGDCSLREAVIDANSHPNEPNIADRIIVPGGTYTLTLSCGEANNATCKDLDILESVDIHGQDVGVTVVDGGGLWRVFDVNPNLTLTIAVKITDMTITGGYDYGGGGLYSHGLADLTLERCAIIGNTSRSGGGGIYNESGTLSIIDSAVSDNVNPNTPPVAPGGGIYNQEGTLTLESSEVIGNWSGPWDGGGIFNNLGQVHLVDSTVMSNLGFEGGGLVNLHGTFTLENCTIYTNTAWSGGGIWQDTGTLTMTNSTVSANAATSTGDVGGIYNDEGTVTLTNSTVSRNQTSGGVGGILNGTGTVNLQSSIVANQLSGSDCSGVIASHDHNLDSDGSCGLNQPNDLPNTDPSLGDLQDNGGPTWTHALLWGSPAIDAIDPISCTLTTDQRGEPRPVDGDGDLDAKCDIGSFEEALVCPTEVLTVTKVQDTADGTCDADCSLREAVIAANLCLDHNTIILPSGTYSLTLGTAGEDEAAQGDLDIAADLTITGDGADTTVVDASPMTSERDRVFHVIGDVAVEISGVTITGGLSPDVGGGIHNPSGALTLAFCTVADNQGADGAGIYNAATLTLTNSTVSGNLPSNNGGGVFNHVTGAATLTDCTISSNDSTQGGGIYNAGTLTSSNCTFTGNSAAGTGAVGGGIWNDGQLSLLNCTVTENSSVLPGGGVHNSGNTGFTNSIVANQLSGGDCQGPINSLGHNLDSDGTCSLDQPSDLPPSDPSLGDLQDNGGPTWTHALLWGSPAIDAIDPISCTLTTDQRGEPRPVDGDGDGQAKCDIGSFETALVCPPEVLTVTKEQDTADGTCDADCSLREAVITANLCPDHNTIILPSGTYSLTLGTAGEDAAAQGDLDIAADLTINGHGADATMVDASPMTPERDRVFHVIGDVTADISGVTVTGGSSTDDGGGVHNLTGALTLSYCTVTDNEGSEGGGIYSTGSVTLTNSTVSGNQAEVAGGGIYNLDPGVATLTNCTVSGNSVPQEDVGGGIYNGGELTLLNCTVVENYALFGGGGILNYTYADLTNTIVANQLSGGDCSGAINSLGHNLDSDGTCGLNQPSDLPNRDPRLGDLQDNGGPTWTHALLWASPATDAGDDAACPASDQRGYPRPHDGDGNGTYVCDIGAFERPTLRAVLLLVFKNYPAP